MKGMRVFFLSVVGLSCAFALGCGGGSSSSSANNSLPPNTIATSGANVAAIAVNGGPPISVDGGPAVPNYADAAFISVIVCTPGTTTCQTIPYVLVDTGSVGLRIVSSLLTVSLPQQTASDGNPVAECLQFLGSYTWGPVQTADVEISGEKASSVPIQVLSDTDFVAPSSCYEPSGNLSADTVANLGTNGILGVGVFPQDCGGTCPVTANWYYECPSSGCVPISQSAAQQVANPVSLFATDNNGVIVELPAVAGGSAATLSGSLVFGIGTQSNNALGSAQVYTVDGSIGNFSTTFDGTAYTDASFLDTGSNGYFFADSSIAQCPDGSGFYCPANTVNLSATNQGITTGSGTVNFSIANADNLFSNVNDFAFSNLGGSPVPSGPATYFDWGLPFFFGRNVYVSIEGTTAPGGTTPYWAY
jgi:hypothetical protein